MSYAIRNKRGAITRELGTDRIEAGEAWYDHAHRLTVALGDEFVMRRDGAWVVLAYVGPVRSEKRAWMAKREMRRGAA